MNALVAPIFDNSFARLSDQLFTRLPPTPVADPALIAVNAELASSLGLSAEWLASDAGIAMVAGNALPPGSDALAAVYAGHQFGGWNPQLGDGRALLLGEVVAPSGQRYDLQLKGSGPTPYSRGGDGRSPLGPVIREYLVSEAMATLGVPTTRALAAVTTGEPVYRERALPGAVLLRVASSHLRVGSMQYFAARRDIPSLELLVDHVLDRHYPEHSHSDTPALALLQAVIDAQAKLIAQWQSLGFIHGVMNTDNMLLCGETVDYGPCAFMDGFHPNTVFSSIDTGGRYAYSNQPGIGHWNLSALAQALLPLLDDDDESAVACAQAAVDRYPELFGQAYRQAMAAKLGLLEWRDGDDSLLEQLLEQLAVERTDFTLFFRALADAADPDSPARKVDHLFAIPEHIEAWMARWQQRIAEDEQSAAQRQRQMYLANPAFIPRN
ncbi:MAG: YdiU family protein, partial [Pseudomonadota bacterium]